MLTETTEFIFLYARAILTCLAKTQKYLVLGLVHGLDHYLLHQGFVALIQIEQFGTHILQLLVLV